MYLCARTAGRNLQQKKAHFRLFRDVNFDTHRVISEYCESERSLLSIRIQYDILDVGLFSFLIQITGSRSPHVR